MTKIILASGSPRRKQILQAIGLNIEIIKSPFIEQFDHEHFNYKSIEQLAYGKAKAVCDILTEDEYLVIGADTVVVLNNKVLGKPKNFEDAKNMLKMLSEKKHCVVTSICVINSKTKNFKIKSTTSYVEFNKLTEEMIVNYINNFKPYDKAGSYGIQELPKEFIKQIEGSYENIIGLCPKALKQLLFQHNYTN